VHTCPPPVAALEKWLNPSGTVEGNYGHLLLEQLTSPDHETLASVRSYFESAHLDAREHFHNQIALSLHPDADDPGAHACYPGCLPPTARRGLFGEVMAGLVTEAFQHEFIGGHNWSVPIFSSAITPTWNLIYGPWHVTLHGGDRYSGDSALTL